MRRCAPTLSLALLALARCSADEEVIAPIDASAPRDVALDRTDAARDAPVASDARDATMDVAVCPAALRCGEGCCERGQVCGAGRCCMQSERCGAACCAPGFACQEGFCERQCGDRSACGPSSARVCCAAGEVCASERCVAPGSVCDDITPCPVGNACEPTLSRCLPAGMSTMCEFRPPPGSFSPREEWHWRPPATPAEVAAHGFVMMAPMVANLTDDNADGRVDARDTPDIVFNAYAPGTSYFANGVLRAIAGDGGADLWPRANPTYRTMPGAGVAIAELDATHPGPEIVTCSPKVGGAGCCDGAPGRVLLVAADGALLREIDAPCGYSAPAVADMDGDGTPEIAVRGAVFHADGRVLFNRTTLPALISVEDYALFADLDGAPDGALELCTGVGAFRVDGTPLWQHSSAEGIGYPAVADLNPAAADGPEIVTVYAGVIRAFRGRDGAPFRGWAGPVMIEGAGGGPPTIADFDGDGAPDVATAGARRYVVVRGATGALLWSSVTQDLSSASTGSSVFDFEGDGAAEAVYNDELRLRVYDGRTGSPRLDACNTTSTLWEYPVIVDVDNDQHAEIVVAQNPYSGVTCGPGGDFGIRVFGDATGASSTWVRTRRIWNQHTYHVTNINEDGTVPRRETRNWTVGYLNNFRQNVQPSALAAPDLRAELVADLSACPASITVRARVTNVGAAGSLAGVGVTFYQLDSSMVATRLGRRTLTRALLPGEHEMVSWTVPLTPERATDVLTFRAVINDAADMPSAELHDCDASNNAAGPLRVGCDVPL